MIDLEAPAYPLSLEQKYEFDLRGFIVLRQHFDELALQEFQAGIDELQAIPIDYDTYRQLGIASHFLHSAMTNREHPFWKEPRGTDHAPNGIHGGVGSVHHAICGTEKFDGIVRDPVLKSIHSELAGGPIYISATYFIEKVGPTAGGDMHNGGYPVDRDLYYGYDHTRGRFSCKSTKSVIILSDMTRIENGPFAAIPGSHKANFSCPFDMENAAQNPMAVPVLAAPGDVVIFSEGMTHNAYPVVNSSIRRSVFFNYMPAIGRDNLHFHRMSIYPDHVLKRLSDQTSLLTSPGYI